MLCSEHRFQDQGRRVDEERCMEEREGPESGFWCPLLRDPEVRKEEENESCGTSSPRDGAEVLEEEECRPPVGEGEDGDPCDSALDAVEDRDRPHPPYPVVPEISEVVHPQVSLGPRVEEEEEEEGHPVRVADGEVPCNREEGEVRPPQELCKGELLVPLRQLVEDLDGIAVGHDPPDVEGVGEREGRDESGRGEREDEEEGQGMPRRDEPLCKGAGAKRAPVAGETGVHIPGIGVPVKVIIEDDPPLEPEEADEGHLSGKYPRDAPVSRSREGKAREEEDRPDGSKVGPGEVEVGPEGPCHASRPARIHAITSPLCFSHALTRPKQPVSIISP